MSKYVSVLLICYSSFAFCFKIPEPEITVFRPRGLTMTIPDQEGVELVAFHVNVNKEINTEEGDYAKYILRPTSGKWVFENRVVRLKTGDAVHYWIFVQRGSLGYRFHNRYFVTDEFSVRDPSTTTTTTRHQPTTPTTRYQPTTPAPSPPPSYALITTPSPIDCSGLITNLSKVVVEMGQQSTLLREENQILRELADKGKYLLRLNSLIVDSGEPEDVVNFVLREKLDIDRKVKSATKVTNHTSIIFEVYSLDEKIHIIKKVKEKLSNSQSIGITYNI